MKLIEALKSDIITQILHTYMGILVHKITKPGRVVHKHHHSYQVVLPGGSVQFGFCCKFGCNFKEEYKAMKRKVRKKNKNLYVSCQSKATVRRR